jgi:hypothetical protein
MANTAGNARDPSCCRIRRYRARFCNSSPNTKSRQLNMRKPREQGERFVGFMRLTLRLSRSVPELGFQHHNYLDPFWSDSYSPSLGAGGKIGQR